MKHLAKQAKKTKIKPKFPQKQKKSPPRENLRRENNA